MNKIMPESWRCPCLETDSYATEISILSDEIASYIGFLLSISKFDEVTIALIKKCQEYHMLIMDVISRVDIITENDIAWIEKEYINLRKLTTAPKGYTMPSGNYSSTLMQIIRAKSRMLARYIFLMHEKENKECELLLKFVNMLSNLYYYLALRINNNHEEENLIYRKFAD